MSLAANNISDYKTSRVQLVITGAVQGVGFRPFVYCLANELGIKGNVSNDDRGVIVDAEAPTSILDNFIQQLQLKQPHSAKIRTIEVLNGLTTQGFSEFTIEPSTSAGSPRVDIMPDLASCDNCLTEASDPGNRRYRYAFTSCTQCGPRWSIIDALPYDRDKTTMDIFPFCPACQQEYSDPSNRRFHHQANACPVCGPTLLLLDNDGRKLTDGNPALEHAVTALLQGKVVALKGLGGFQLIVDAGNELAIEALRERKQRWHKPLALMCQNLQQTRSICNVSAAEEELLQSAAAPIVLLKRKEQQTHVANAVAPGNPYLGVMLPTTILHHLLLQDIGKPLVVTSGNLSGEPICIHGDEALERLGNIADLFLSHNRPIARPLDDSVAQVVLDKPMLLRRARGYAPSPIPLSNTSNTSSPTVLAVGSYLKNTIATHMDDRALLGAHIGDLDNPVSRRVFEQRIDNLCDVYQLQPELLVHDSHPDYPSTQYAMRSGIQCHAVQHHHAHIAACIAEHGLSGKIAGVSWDGTGLGDDGTAWGGEFLLADLDHYERSGSFLPFPLIGGDKAAKDPRRVALALLYTLYAGEHELVLKSPLVALFSQEELHTFLTMLDKNINLMPTSSVGRLFDGVACLLNLSARNRFEGEAAMALQFAAEQANMAKTTPIIELPHTLQQGLLRFDWRPLITHLIKGIEQQAPAEQLALYFHQALAQCILSFCQIKQHNRITLSGGCFQNRLLLSITAKLLKKHGIEVYWPQIVPANDGGIAFGQLAIGQSKLNQAQSR